ncbi:MAG: hypothetical protein APR63_15055 [Desulfuromonas sp. SDB]|nr:MAG: hypothetical protein APR63_15055 [Desulfuromonas sp. SDB]
MKKEKLNIEPRCLSFKIVLLLFAVVIILSFWHTLIPGRMLDCGDQLLGYSFKQFAAQSIKSGQGLPLWNPYIFNGFPYLASMHGDILYPSALLRLFLPVELVISLIFIIHFYLAGIFAYLFAKKLKASDYEALIIGILYMFTGIIISQVNPGHDGKVIVQAFTPAIFLLLSMGVEQKRLLPYLLAGGLVGLCLLAPNVQLTYYLLMGSFIWFCSELIAKCRKNWKQYFPHLIYVVISLSLGIAIAAIQFIPFLEYSDLSPRQTGRGWEFATSWSMAPVEFFDTFIAGFSGLLENYWGANPFKLHTEYFGIIPLLLSPLAFFPSQSESRRRAFTFLGIAAFFTIVSFGGHTPLYKLFYYILPGFKQFRAPSISFFMVSFSLISLVTLGLINFRNNVKGKQILIITGAILLLILLISPAIANNAAKQLEALGRAGENFNNLKLNILISALVMFSVITLLWLSIKFKKQRYLFLVLIAVIAFFDLIFTNGKFVKEMKDEQGKFISAEDLYGADQVVNYINDYDSLGKVIPNLYFDLEITSQGFYPKNSHANDNYLMANEIYSVGGYHGNQLQRYQDLIGLPGTIMFQSGGLLNENINLSRGLGIKYQPVSALIYNELVRLSRDNPEQAVQLAQNIGVGKAGITRMAEGIVQPLGEMVLIIDTLALPRMFCVNSDTVIENDTSCLEYIHNPNFDFSQQVVLSQPLQFNPSASGEVTIVEFKPDRIVAEVKAFGPTVVVINDNYTPDWKAYLNGQSIPVIRANYALRAVGINEAGTYTLELIYQPNSVKIGLIITIGAIVLWLIGIIISARKIL